MAARAPQPQEIIGYGTLQPNSGPMFFPFAPNWKSPMDETLTFRSWALTADGGSEQTGSIDGNRPRRQIEYAITLNHRRTQLLENLLVAWQSRKWFVAHWGEGSKLQQDAALGAGTLTLDTTMRSFTPGRHAVIYSDPDTWEIVVISAKTDTYMLLGNGGTRFAWPAGTRVYPVFEGYINASLRGSRLTDSLVQIPVSFLCDPTTTEPNVPPGTEAAMYRGIELYRGRLNWADGVESSFDSDVRLIDLGSGAVKTHSASRWTANVRKHNVLLKNMPEIFAFRQWLGRREGLARPCWMDSGMTDFTLYQPLQGGSQNVYVFKNRYGDLLAGHPARRDIIIHFRDGSYVVRRITHVVNYAQDADYLVLDAPLPATLAPVKRISYLNCYRLTAPAVTLRWVTDRVVTSEVNLKPRSTPLDLVSSAPAMPQGEQGRTYSYHFTAGGGLRPYTWALTGGELPTGLTLASTGHLSGLPEEAGTWSITATATDIEGNTATVTRTLTITVAEEIELIGSSYTMSSAWQGLSIPNNGTTLRDANVEGGLGTNTGGKTGKSAGIAEYIRVDLGRECTVKHVVLGGGTLPSGNNYVSPSLNGRLLQYSTNDEDWITVLTVGGITDTGQVDRDFDIPDTTARYWRVAAGVPGHHVAAATFRLFGFEVNGT